MKPRKEAVSPVDTVRRRGRSEEVVIATGDGIRDTRRVKRATNAVRSTRRTRRVSGSFSSRAVAFQRSAASMWGLRSRTEDSEERPRTRRRGSRRRWKSDRGRGTEEPRTVEQYDDTVTASEMKPRKEAVSPVDTVRRRGRSEEAVIAKGDGKRDTRRVKRATNAVRSTRRTRRVSGSFSSRAVAFQRSAASMWGLRSRTEEDSEKRPRTRRRGSRRRWKSDRGRGPEEPRTVDQYGDGVGDEATERGDFSRRHGAEARQQQRGCDRGRRRLLIVSIEGSPNKAV
ncbi:hypothetical protein OPV22_030710 [Ensete ventricosum]|uniref:Uncharacterized protein n=1 Tax=Ensete ventricosum TaxID=4639 RepID=A0AAV8PUG7_ENSVE|nr:hypothetical protein OPV22_030710 [Ensete ventricosum]